MVTLSVQELENSTRPANLDTAPVLLCGASSELMTRRFAIVLIVVVLVNLGLTLGWMITNRQIVTKPDLKGLTERIDAIQSGVLGLVKDVQLSQGGAMEISKEMRKRDEAILWHLSKLLYRDRNSPTFRALRDTVLANTEVASAFGVPVVSLVEPRITLSKTVPGAVALTFQGTREHGRLPALAMTDAKVLRCTQTPDGRWTIETEEPVFHFHVFYDGLEERVVQKGVEVQREDKIGVVSAERPEVLRIWYTKPGSQERYDPRPFLPSLPPLEQ